MKLKIETIVNTCNEDGVLLKSDRTVDYQDTDRMLSFGQVEKQFNCYRQTVRRWAFSGLLPYETIAGRYYVRESALKNFKVPARGYPARTGAEVAV